GDERLAVGGAALRVAQSVEIEHNALTDTERVEDAATERDNLDVGLRLSDANQLHADLVELAEPSPLRALVAEHRAAVEEFERRALDEAVRDYRADHAGRILGPQRHFLAAAVGKRVHLLGDDVGVLADRSDKDFGEFENRRGD